MLVDDLENHLQKLTGDYLAAPVRRQMLTSLSPVYYFEGKTKDAALVIAGIHGSEPSGIEIANWLRVMLDAQAAKGNKPYYSTFIVPEVFHTEADKGRRSHHLKDPPGTNTSNEGRDVIRNVIPGTTLVSYPNRLFAPPGRPSTYLLKSGSLTPLRYLALDDQRDPQPFKTYTERNKRCVEVGISVLLEEILAIMLLIEAIKPKRDGKRDGAPVFTVETFENAESGAFRRARNDFEQLLDDTGKPKKGVSGLGEYDANRCLQLQAYAKGLMQVFLEEFKAS